MVSLFPKKGVFPENPSKEFAMGVVPKIMQIISCLSKIALIG